MGSRLDLAMLSLAGALEGHVMILGLVWLGGILLCATPYAWALCRAARESVRPAPPRRRVRDSDQEPASCHPERAKGSRSN
jgi:hypothetical protein